MSNKIVEISRKRKEGIRKFIFSHFKTNTILILSFLMVILIGSFLLMLPFSTTGARLGFLDALFNATSATCVTGLVTIVPIKDLTIFGQLVMLCMIQIGGLGFMTFVSIILLFTKNKLSFKERSLLKDALNKDSYNNIGEYISDIIAYTLLFELVGAIILFTQFYNPDNVLYSIFQSIFIAISAFCNAGIDILGPSSIIPYQSNLIVNLVVTSLIIFGGLGFAVWFDLKNKVFLFKFFKNPRKCLHRLKIHSKIVLYMTTLLIISGFLLILVFEWNASLKGLSLFDKFMAAYFNSVTLRTAGFASINYAELSLQTKLFMCFYMLIGGSPGGTAGGFKTTTLFILVFAIVAELKGVEAFNFKGREIPKRNFTSASVIFMLYIVIFFFSIFILTMSEPFDLVDLTFEAASALGTVGLSVGITSSLSVIGKIVIIVLMFIGRLGPVSIMLLLQRSKSTDKTIKYPVSDILVG